MEPGWSPLPGDPHPYFQVDFLEPTWVSGVITQGSERMWGYISKYSLAFALAENHFTDFTETGVIGSAPKVGNKSLHCHGAIYSFWFLPLRPAVNQDH